MASAGPGALGELPAAWRGDVESRINRGGRACGGGRHNERFPRRLPQQRAAETASAGNDKLAEPQLAEPQTGGSPGSLPEPDPAGGVGGDSSGAGRRNEQRGRRAATTTPGKDADFRASWSAMTSYRFAGRHRPGTGPARHQRR